MLCCAFRTAVRHQKSNNENGKKQRASRWGIGGSLVEGVEILRNSETPMAAPTGYSAGAARGWHCCQLFCVRLCDRTGSASNNLLLSWYPPLSEQQNTGDPWCKRRLISFLKFQRRRLDRFEYHTVHVRQAKFARRQTKRRHPHAPPACTSTT